MNPSQTKSERHRQKRSERRRRRRLEKEAATASTIYIPDHLIKQVLSFLPIKSLIRLKCVSKPFNSLISNHTFIKLHLNRSSSPNTNLTFVHSSEDLWYIRFGGINQRLSFKVVRMLDNNPQFEYAHYDDPNDDNRDRNNRYLVGSCNGLLCFFYHSDSNNQSWFRFWNPATRAISDKLGYFLDNQGFTDNFTFGYDNLKDTFKVVRFFPDATKVRVFSLKDNVWRNIQDSPVAHRQFCRRKLKYVHFSNSVNWLVICNHLPPRNYYYKDISIDQFVIISLNLRTETHTKLLLPRGFNEVPFYMPNLSVLNDYLCFSHDFRQTHFIIWQMREFGWTQFIKISYDNLIGHSSSYTNFVPLCLLEKNHTLLLSEFMGSRALLYNWRDNSAKFIDQPSRLIYTEDYVESLFSYR